MGTRMGLGKDSRKHGLQRALSAVCHKRIKGEGSQARVCA